METILNDEKEKYFLKLAQEGVKIPQDYNVETIFIQEEESKTSKLQKKYPSHTRETDINSKKQRQTG